MFPVFRDGIVCKKCGLVVWTMGVSEIIYIIIGSAPRLFTYLLPHSQYIFIYSMESERVNDHNNVTERRERSPQLTSLV